MRFVCPSCRGIISNDGLKSSEEFVQCGHCDEIVKIPPSRLSPGAVIGDFIIEREIGRGGMGVVFLSHQISLDRPAALKVLQDNFSKNAGFVVSFIREARAAAKLNHPHIVQAYAVGEDEGIFYFAMEFIEGETMKHVLAREHKISCERALPIIQQVVEALDCAWKEAKLVHRDIKPDNIMLASADRVKLADLGLSQKAGEMDDADSDEVMGTPQYISPEHLTGAPMDNRSDIYSLGATFYQFVTGEFPFKGNNPNEIARKHLEEPLVPPRDVNPEIPQEVNDIIVRMMQKNPVDRYQTNDELLDVLREARHHLPLRDVSGAAATATTPGRKIVLSVKKSDTSAAAATSSVPTGEPAVSGGAKINLTPPRGGMKIKLNHPGKAATEAAPDKPPIATEATPVDNVAAVENKESESGANNAHMVTPPAGHKLSGLKLKGAASEKTAEAANPPPETSGDGGNDGKNDVSEEIILETTSGGANEAVAPAKSIDKLIIWGGIGFIVVVVIGLAAWFGIKGGAAKPDNRVPKAPLTVANNSGSNSGVTDGGKNVPEIIPYTTKSEYARKVEAVFYHFQKNGSEFEFLRNAQDVFDSRLKPVSSEDKIWHGKLESLVNSISEKKLIQPYREGLRAKHQAEAAARMEAFKEVDSYRREQKLKEMVEERKLVEKEGVGAVQTRKTMTMLQEKRADLVVRMLDYYADNRVPELRLELKDAIMNVGSYSGESKKLVQLHNYAVNNYLQLLDAAATMTEIMKDGSQQLNGMQVEVIRSTGGKPEIGLLKTFINGNIGVLMDDGKIFYCRIENLTPGQRVEFFNRMERKVNQPNLLLSTLILSGNFDKINRAVPASKFWKEHLNAFEYNYFRKKLGSMTPPEVGAARMRFGRLPGFRKAVLEVFPPSEEDEEESNEDQF